MPLQVKSSRVEELTRPGEKAVETLCCLPSLSHRGNTCHTSGFCEVGRCSESHSTLSSFSGKPHEGKLLLWPTAQIRGFPWQEPYCWVLCANLPDPITSLVQGTTATISLGSHVHTTLVRIFTLCQVGATVSDHRTCGLWDGPRSRVAVLTSTGQY